MQGPGYGADRRAYTDLGRCHEILQVRIADRPFQWPHAGLYAGDLAEVPTVIVELLNRSAPRQAFDLVAPTTDDELADLDHEPAARVSTLCTVAMVDCHHLAGVPGYDERLDQAITAAGVAGADRPAGGPMPPPLVADPAYHLLHQALRRHGRGQVTAAEDDLRPAVTLLSCMDAGPKTSLRGLLRTAFTTGRLHHKQAPRGDRTHPRRRRAAGAARPGAAMAAAGERRGGTPAATGRAADRHRARSPSVGPGSSPPSHGPPPATSSPRATPTRSYASGTPPPAKRS